MELVLPDRLKQAEILQMGPKGGLAAAVSLAEVAVAVVFAEGTVDWADIIVAAAAAGMAERIAVAEEATELLKALYVAGVDTAGVAEVATARVGSISFLVTQNSHSSAILVTQGSDHSAVVGMVAAVKPIEQVLEVKEALAVSHSGKAAGEMVQAGVEGAKMVHSHLDAAKMMHRSDSVVFDAVKAVEVAHLCGYLAMTYVEDELSALLQALEV